MIKKRKKGILERGIDLTNMDGEDVIRLVNSDYINKYFV
jgi:hypothetical protein